MALAAGRLAERGRVVGMAVELGPSPTNEKANENDDDDGLRRLSSTWLWLALFLSLFLSN